MTLFAICASAQAQTFEQVAPQTIPVAPAVLPAAAASAAEAGDRVIVPSLRGIVFVTSRSELQVQGVSVDGVSVRGRPATASGERTPYGESLRELVMPYIGQPLSLGALNRLTRDVVLHFRQQGRPVVDVLVPEQNVTSGTVQILVVEGRVGTVRAEGNIWFTAEHITSAVRARPGEVIAGGPLLTDLAWINQNPFRQVDLVFARGDEPGETDIVLRTRDRFPVRGFVGYEDSGNALTGFDRVIAGVNWGNAFGRDHQLSYQLSASPDFEKMVAHSGSYIMPLPAWRDTFTVYGSYAESRPELAGGFFSLKGRTWQVSARYRMPLPTTGPSTRSVTAGVDFKRSNNNLSFGGAQVFAQENDVVQAIAAFQASHTGRNGQTSGEFTLAFSPGGISSGNHTSNYQAARSFAQPEYAYARLELERSTRLPAAFSWVVRGTAQYATANLLGSEQLGLGGSANLRGYEEREANGDDGIIVVNELRGPLLGGIEPLVFVDFGAVRSHERLPGEPDHLVLASAGLGFRYNLSGHINIRADYGWQLTPSGVSDGRRTGRGHVSAVVSY